MSQSEQPLAKGSNRNAQGQFTQGCEPGPGNPHAAKVAKFRRAILDSATEQDVQQIITMLITQAKAGDLQAAAIVLDRLVGKAAVPLEPAGDRPRQGFHTMIAAVLQNPTLREQAYGLAQAVENRQIEHDNS